MKAPRGSRSARATLALFPFVVACTHVPSGFRKATAEEMNRWRAWRDRLSTGCAPQGSFLAEVQPLSEGKAGIGFQMEGAWSADGGPFEAQFLSPLGEAWAQFSLAGATSGVDAVRYGQGVTEEQKAALQTFLDTLATIGAPNLRAMACGHGLVRLEKERLFLSDGPDGADGEARLPDATWPSWRVEGRLPLRGTTLSLETTVSSDEGFSTKTSTGTSTGTSTKTQSVARMSAKVKAGLWGSHEGHITWEGALPAQGSPVPKRLQVRRDGAEGATLTFLEFE